MSEHSSRDSSRDRSLNKKDKNDKKISKKPPATSSPKVPVFIQGTGFTRKNYPTAFSTGSVPDPGFDPCSDFGSKTNSSIPQL
jgi:hypothetical protein